MADLLIRQFDVFANPERRRSSLRFVVVLQLDLVSDSTGVVAAPLLPDSSEFRGQRLFPKVRVEGREFVILVPQLATVPRTLLRSPVCNVRAERDRIVLALDYLSPASESVGG